MTARAVVLVSLLAAIWGARGEPPGSASGGQITTRAVIHFGAEPAEEYGKTSYGVQGLQYFASPGANQLPGLQHSAFLVYPGSVVSANNLAQSPQIGGAHAPGGYAYIAQPSPSTAASAAVPNYFYGVQFSSGSTGVTDTPHYVYAAQSSSTGDTGTPHVYAAQSTSTGDTGTPQYVYAAQSSSAGVTGTPQYVYAAQSSSAGVTGTPHYVYAAQPSSGSTGGASTSHYTYSEQPSSSSTAEGTTHSAISAQSSSSVTPITSTATSESHNAESLHQNVDITYDSLASTNYPTFTTPAPPSSPPPLPTRTSAPPMKAITYGPPKPVIIGPFLNARHRHKTTILVPHLHHNPKLHFHQVPHLHFHSPKHLHPEDVLLKTRPHHNPVSIKKPALQSHHINSVSHPDITKAIFHSKPVDSYAAATQNHQQSILPYYLHNYAIVHHRSDQEEKHEGNDLNTGPELQTTPVIVYKGVRPPVSVYHKPQPLPALPVPPKPIIEHEDFQDSGNSLSPQSLGTVSSSSWMPINAPEGAVPARAYDIPAPDLSRGYDHAMGATEADYPHTFHHNNKAGSVSTIPVSNYFLERPEDDEAHYGEVYRGDSEGVVSAVVLVKQR